MSEKKPVIVPAIAPRRVCPVCGKASYSRTGTHPQCALARADAVSNQARKAANVPLDEAPRKLWSKPCPKCKRQIHARRIVCDCGHNFGSVPGSVEVPRDHQSSKLVRQRPR